MDCANVAVHTQRGAGGAGVSDAPAPGQYETPLAWVNPGYGKRPDVRNWL